MIIWWKEIRSILPLWLGVLAAMWLPELLNLRPFGMERKEWLLVSTVIGGACIATTVYAREFHDRTMLWQLVQPVGRLSILGRKFGLLLIALAPIIVLAFSLDSSRPWLTSIEGRYVATVLGGTLLAIGLTSVCLLSILTRNMLGTAVMTVVLPLLLVGILIPWIEWLGEGYFASPAVPILCAFLSYSVVTGIAAVLLWRRMELLGDAVAISGIDVRVFSRLTADTAFKLRSASAVLFRKELGLLRFVFWITALYLVSTGLYLFSSLVLNSMEEDALRGLQGFSIATTHPGLYRLREVWDPLGAMTFGFHFALVPALCGGLAFGEETYFGTRAWQLCQSVSLTRQWLVKLGTAAGLSILAGLLVPAVVLFLGSIVPGTENIRPRLDADGLSQALCIHLLVFATTAWCASWSRTTASAVAKALLLLVGLFMLNSSAAEWSPNLGLDWRVTALPVAICALVLTFPNFKTIELPARRWVAQLLVLALVAAAAVFFQESSLGAGLRF